MTWSGTDSHLASFPEQNPNPVFELDGRGRVIYLNPVAEERFPDLSARGAEHPLVGGFQPLQDALAQAGEGFLAREVDLGTAVFEQKICRRGDSADSGLRVFVHDVTDLRRAHGAIRALARRVLDAQEEERRRISRELHDDAGQALTALRIALGLLADEPPETTKALRHELLGVRELVDETRERIRRLALGLRPSLLDVMGLEEAIAAECESFARRTGIDVDCSGELPAQLGDASATAVFRFVQEGLSNVVRHAGTARVAVGLRERARHAEVELSDDGRGFEPTDARLSAGVGLRGLEERFALLGGGFEIDSRPGHGTRLRAWLPHGVAEAEGA